MYYFVPSASVSIVFSTYYYWVFATSTNVKISICTEGTEDATEQKTTKTAYRKIETPFSISFAMYLLRLRHCHTLSLFLSLPPILSPSLSLSLSLDQLGAMLQCVTYTVAK
jgi:hypothetical protein